MQPLEQLVLDQHDLRNAGLLGRFDNIAGRLVTLATEQIQREQDEAEMKNTWTVKRLRKQAEKWYSAMLAEQSRYQPHRPQAYKIDGNLTRFQQVPQHSDTQCVFSLGAHFYR